MVLGNAQTTGPIAPIASSCLQETEVHLNTDDSTKEEQLRMRCLEMAAYNITGSTDYKAIVERAKRIYRFLKRGT